MASCDVALSFGALLDSSSPPGLEITEGRSLRGTGAPIFLPLTTAGDVGSDATLGPFTDAGPVGGLEMSDSRACRDTGAPTFFAGLPSGALGDAAAGTAAGGAAAAAPAGVFFDSLSAAGFADD